MKYNINNTIKDTKNITLSIFDSPLEIITLIILHASATKRKDTGNTLYWLYWR
ncbi:MAG: hypothetical protein IPG24_28385 [Leptospiraceae bacterium]|nr:hypothetical protein [Leptospiraceae bacterium]